MKNQKSGILKKLSVFLAFSCLVSLIYSFYDLAYPNHFVGDMYGMEVMFRGGLLLFLAGVAFTGLMLVIVGFKEKKAQVKIIGFVFLLLCTAILIFLFVNTVLKRHEFEVRKTYEYKSVNELIEIAENKGDQFAIYELIKRKDPSSVPDLCRLLLDENQPGNIRMEAAVALFAFGGEKGKKALLKAKINCKNPYLLQTIEYGLEQQKETEHKG